MSAIHAPKYERRGEERGEYDRQLFLVISSPERTATLETGATIALFMQPARKGP